MYVEDTIVAPATPPGRGAVAIVRLSGPRALEIARQLWKPLDSRIPPARRLLLGEIRDPHTHLPIDRAMAVFFPGPHSLTGEDVAELHCHGGVYLVRRVVGVAMVLGARMAQAGEFSRRAFLNGRIGLTEAEAIKDLVEACGERALGLALAQLGGALARKIAALRQQVLALRAHLEAEIDFADEDLELPPRAAIAAAIARLDDDVVALKESFAHGRIMREGARAAIVGKPNAGKSSVLNLMLGVERAIVTPVPGTTRDVIEDSISLGGYPLVVQDTAGVREGGDEPERVGIARARRQAAEADLIVAVFDAARPLQTEDREVIALTRGRPGVALLNKCDLPALISERDLKESGLELPALRFSALAAIGIDELRAALLGELEALAGAGTGGGDGIAISRERHREALRLAHEALQSAQRNALAAMPPEIVAVDIAQAAEALGSITGAVTTEDVLDLIFREFCIGK